MSIEKINIQIQNVPIHLKTVSFAHIPEFTF